MNDTSACTDTVTLDPENPWLGLFSYTEETRAYFHGRDAETAELARRVEGKLLTILFGQSGLGKTSLLRAGLVPRLRDLGYCPVYVRVDYAPTSPTASEQIKQAVFRATAGAGHWTRPGVSVKGEPLWEFLHKRGDLLRDAEGNTLTPLLIFDQFEEIFTLGQADDAGKQRAKQFLDDLADLVENRAPASLEAKLEDDDSLVDQFDFERADYRVLIALREDYLPHLEGLKGEMPSITQNRMRLARMTGQQALSAVTKPGGKLVTQEVAEAIVRFVAGGSELANAEIEPSLLSLVCRELNTARLSQGKHEISADLLAGSRDTILSEFYERALADQPEGVRRVIEDELLTESGYRESLAEERVRKALADAGGKPDALPTLVNRRLLRIEDRLDLRRVELTHDVLCGVVRASREQRHAREAKDAAEHQLAAQREREAAAHRALRRAQLIAGVCIVLLLIAIAGGVFGYFSTRRAKVAEAQATAARANAEALVGNLMNKFYAEVAPTGQTATLGNLAEMAVAYYAKLPASQMTPQTKINFGMALVRLGQSENAGAHFKAGARHLRAAQALFEKLRAAGHHGDAVTYGLALDLYEQGYATANGGATGNFDASAALHRAARLLHPLVYGPHPSRRARQAYADNLNVLAAFQTPRQVLAGSAEARKVLAGLGAQDLSDLTAATSYVAASLNEAGGLMALSKPAQAQPLAQQAYAMTGKVLARRPGDLNAMAYRSGAATALLSAAERLHDLEAAAGYAAQETQAAEDWLGFDPSNADAWDTRLSSYADTAYVQFQRGDISGALASLQAGLTLAHDPRAHSALAGEAAGYSAMLALQQSQAGEAAAAARSVQAYAREARAGFGKFAAKDPIRQLVAHPKRWLDAGVQLAGGAPRAALAHSTESIAQQRAVKVPGSNLNDFGIKASNLDYDFAIAAAAALRLGRYPQAAALARQRLALLQRWAASPDAAKDAGDEYWFTAAGLDPLPAIETPQAQTTLANALAMQGKQNAAAKVLAPALKYYAKQQKAGAHGTTFRHDYAYAFYVESLTAPAGAAGAKQRTADLAEAAKLIAGASRQARQLSQFRYLSGEIAAAREPPHV